MIFVVQSKNLNVPVPLSRVTARPDVGFHRRRPGPSREPTARVVVVNITVAVPRVRSDRAHAREHGLDVALARSRVVERHGVARRRPLARRSPSTVDGRRLGTLFYHKKRPDRWLYTYILEL